MDPLALAILTKPKPSPGRPLRHNRRPVATSSQKTLPLVVAMIQS